MGLLDNKAENSKWKEKYLNLLDEQDHHDQLNKENEALFCKTIIRLCFAASGFNPHLDPHLKRIRSLLKKGVQSELLKNELETFSNALLQLQEAPAAKQIDVKILFDFLLRHYSDNKTAEALQALHNNYLQGHIPDSTKLINSIIEIIDTGNNDQSEAVNFTDNTYSETRVDTEIVSTHILHLLDNAEIPANFQAQAESLSKNLQGKLSAKPFQKVLDESITLLLDIKKHIQEEQQNIQNFLSNITEQLTELGKEALGASADSDKNDISRNELDLSVSEQMQKLRQSSANATTLESLKGLINSRLEHISHQIVEHNKLEKEKRQTTKNQLQEMTTKIHKMESESNDLKYRLKVAHNKALRDQLTGLPNRMAYDERQVVEIARWKRYQSPLSLLIWDIDHFKVINDDFGHQSGDKTLVLIAKLLSGNCRATDFVARFGGEEFIMLLPDTNQNSALNLANHIRKIIENTNFSAKQKSIQITISCGISQFTEDDTIESVFENADQALYTAKTEGRNRCLIYSP